MHQSLPTSASQASQSHAKHTLFIDTDIGDDIDDAFAVALALSSPEIELKGISTVFGDTKLRARLAAHLLATYGSADIPVAAGIGTPLQAYGRPSGVPQAAILDPRASSPALSPLSGPDLLIQTAQQHYRHLIVLCLGPLTNIATALAREPSLFMAIQRIILMGGTSGIPFPEWNVRNDAQAANIVLGSGIPVTLLGWNVTTRCQLRASDVTQLREHNTAQTQLLHKLLQVWQRHRPRWQPALPFLHDPLTIAALCEPAIFSFEEMNVRVVTRGPLQGFMVPRMIDGPLVHAAVDIQAEKARTWIMSRLLSHAPTLGN